MNLKSFILFISLFEIFYSLEVGGIKFAISEKMANDVLYHFIPDIRRELHSMKLDDIKGDIGAEKITMGISNLSLDNFKLKFTENGINLKITGLKAWAKGIAYIDTNLLSIHRDASIDVHEFNFNVNLLVRTKRDKDNKLVPDVYYKEAPTYNVDFDIDIDDILFFVDDIAEEVLEILGKKIIDSFMTSGIQTYLDQAISDVQKLMVIPIDQAKGLYIDCSLVDIKMKNGYIEVNSYAFLYNENKPETKKSKRIPLSIVPQITSIDNPNQLFVSKYSINSALYTYFETNPLSLTLNVNTNLLGLLLPSFISKFPNKKTDVLLETTEPTTLEFLQNKINGKIFGRIVIKLEGRNDPIFVCSIQITTKVELFTMKEKEISISGNITELIINVKEITVNEASSEFLLENINKLIPIVLSVLNEYIKQNIKLPLPCFFKDIRIEFKDKYLSIYYSLKKEIYFTDYSPYIERAIDIFKGLLFKCDVETYKTFSTSIIKLINDMFNKFPKNNALIQHLALIASTISKIPTIPTDINKGEGIFQELIQRFRDFEKYANLPNSRLEHLGEELNIFFGQLYVVSLGPEIVQNKQYVQLVNHSVAKLICLIEDTLSGHYSMSDYYFMWKDFDYRECTITRAKKLNNNN